MALVIPRPLQSVPLRPTGRREAVVLGVAGLLFATVFLLRMFTGTVADAYSMFYTFPVALIATYFGMRAGAGAGLLAVVLVGAWAFTKDIDLDPLGWSSRIVPLLLLGVLLGEATDRMRRTEEERRKLEAAALLHREAIEINDSLVQGMAAAKWALEAGSLDAGLRTLDDTISRAHDLVSGLIRRADMGGHTERLDDAPSAPSQR